MSVIFMSKDRAFQLRECARTFVAHAARGADRVREMHVLWDAIPSLEASYQTLQREWQREVGQFRRSKSLVGGRPSSGSSVSRGVRVAFHRDGKGGFASTLQRICEENKASVILFVVDDMLFYRDFSLDSLESCLAKDSKVLAYHLGLHPGVTYCHPADAKAVPPPFVGRGNDSVVFRRVLGSQDWNYPWNLCGGAYRGADVAAILAAIVKAKGEQGIAHPNRLEVNGNAAVTATGYAALRSPSHAFRVSNCCFCHRLHTKCPLSACPNRAVSSVITINRVQDVYKNRIYAAETGAHGSVPADVVKLDALYRANPALCFDQSAYARKEYKSVHIGDVFVRGLAKPQSEPKTQA